MVNVIMEKILIAALKNIASMGKGGKCTGNCNAPRLAIEALVDYDNAMYKEGEREKNEFLESISRRTE